jgi:hypothetical protein
MGNCQHQRANPLIWRAWRLSHEEGIALKVR